MSAAATVAPSVESAAQAAAHVADHAGDAQPPSYGASTAPAANRGGAAPAVAQHVAPDVAANLTNPTTLQLVQEALRHLLALNQQSLTASATTTEETARLNAEMRDVIRDVGGCIRDMTQLVDHNHDHLVDVESMASALAVKHDAFAEGFRREGDMTRAEVHSHRVHFGEFIGSLGIRLDRQEGVLNDVRAGLVAHRDDFLRFAAVVNEYCAADRPAWESVLRVPSELAALRGEVESLHALVKAYFELQALRHTPAIDPSLIPLVSSPNLGSLGSPLTPLSPSLPPMSPATSYTSSSSGGRREGTPYYPRADKSTAATPVVSRAPVRRYSFGDSMGVGAASETASGYGPAALN
ncbi:hypothetical protein AURDEDRAFT_164579 [Auricularia subglabra TFB-10046 SS5]|nr:hypothetical protein AURDEDRAFT_164579 [Auricularia subglabra TFB-10046 SS5]